MRKALRIAAVNIGLIAVVIVAAELVFGTWITGPDYSVLNIRRNTVRHFDVSKLYPGGGVIRYSRDTHGLRGDYATPADIDVLVLGGSTTDEINIDDADTWVAVLAGAFRRTGRDLTIVNAAVDGQSTLGHLYAMDLWFPNIPGLRPSAVLVYVGINDTAVDPDDAHRYDEMKSPDALRRARQYVMNHSVLYNRVRQIRGLFTAQRTRLVHGGGGPRPPWRPVAAAAEKDARALADAIRPRLDAFTDRLRRLARRIREEFGAETIYITQTRGDVRSIDGRLMTRSADPGAAEAQRNLALFNRRTLSVCAEVKLTCVDLAQGIAFEDGDFYDGIHTTPAGSRRIGRFVFESLKDVLK